jgi:hypothetical protein
MAAGLKLVNLDRINLSSGVTNQLYPTSFPTYSIILTAESANSGNVYIGDSLVDEDRGIPIEPGNTLTIDSSGEGKHTELDASDLYAFTNSSGNKVRISCLRRRN